MEGRGNSRRGEEKEKEIPGVHRRVVGRGSGGRHCFRDIPMLFVFSRSRRFPFFLSFSRLASSSPSPSGGQSRRGEMGIDHAQPSDDLRFPATLPVTHPNPPYAARACVHGASITAWKKKKGSRIYSRSGQNWSNSIFGEGERLLRAIKITEESKRGLKTKACERSGRKANHPQIASHAGLSKRVDGLKEGFKVRELATTIVATAVVRAAGPQESNEKPRGVHVYAAASGPRE